MKRRIVIVAGLACAGMLFLSPNISRGQTNVAPAPPGAPQAPGQPPAQRPRMPGLPMANRAIMDLNSVKMQMQRSTDTFGGHRDSCIAACDKAIEELSAVIAASGGRPPRPFMRPPGPLPPGAPPPAQQTAPPAPAPSQPTPPSP